MPNTLSIALVASLLTAEPTLPLDLQLSYRGSVSPLNEDRSPGDPQKSFDLTILITASGETARQLYWTVEERGRGGWPWIERFGSLVVNADGKASAATGPALLYDLGESTSTLRLTLPFLATDRTLEAGLEWRADPWSFRVIRSTQLEGVDVWQVEVSNNYGPKRTIWVSSDSPIAVGVNERVFMGMGQEFQLQMRLVAKQSLTASQLSARVAGFDALSALKGRLNLPGPREQADWNARQLAILNEHLPAMEKTSVFDALDKLLKTARRDLDLQNGRANSISKLVAEQTGKQVGEFRIAGLDREIFTAADLKGQVTVLHFWDYRDAPLEEPYGQTGYLDFLAQRRRKDNVKVFGVAVDGRLSTEEDRAAAIRGIRKLKAFMNLSYPILLDGGPLIRQFGDPRLLGAELPLWVVLDREGKVAAYRVGLQEVDRNEGLKQLDATLNAVIGVVK